MLKHPSTLRLTLPQDLLASVVVFLVAVPLAMGIAIASGAPPAAGLITGIIGGIVGGSLSGCPLQVSGPAAGLAVLVFELIREFGIEVLGPIVVLAGAIQLVAGVLRVGQIFRSIAPAVVYGMLAGIGVLIFAAQFHVMVDDVPRESGIGNLVAIPAAIYSSLFPFDGNAHQVAALIGVATIGIWLSWNKFAPDSLRRIPGALIGVMVATAAAQSFDLPIKHVDIPDDFLGNIHLPSLARFSVLADPQFLLMAAALAVVASAETLLSAAAVDQMHSGPRTNYDRELLSQGAGNVIAGLLGGLPMTGVIVRSATNVSAGAKTRLSAILHSVWLLILVLAAPGVLRLVPTASLAGVLVYTGYKLVSIQNIRRLLQYGAKPVIIYAVTLLVIVADDLLTGIICGLILSLGAVVYSMTHLSIQSRETQDRIDVDLDGAATFLRMPMLVDRLEKLPAEVEAHVHVRNLTYIDHACLDSIAAWEKQRNEKGAKTVVEWQELMKSYQRSNLFANSTTERPLADGNH